jgi:hypothetical protein
MYNIHPLQLFTFVFNFRNCEIRFTPSTFSSFRPHYSTLNNPHPPSSAAHSTIMPTHEYLVMCELMPESYLVATSYSIRTEPHILFHSLDTAKQCIQTPRILIRAAGPAWMIEMSYVRQLGEEMLTRFTIQDVRDMVVQVVWIQRVGFSYKCGYQERDGSDS